MKQLPEEQRPYEKCFTQGESALSDSELLAVILRSGTQGKNSLTLAQEILKVMEKSSYPGLTGLLHISVHVIGYTIHRFYIFYLCRRKIVQHIDFTVQKRCSQCCVIITELHGYTACCESMLHKRC